jgi:hypothetical protein
VVTFQFTDVEGSTRRWEADADAMRAALVARDWVLVQPHGDARRGIKLTSSVARLARNRPQRCRFLNLAAVGRAAHCRLGGAVLAALVRRSNRVPDGGNRYAHR